MDFQTAPFTFVRAFGGRQTRASHTVDQLIAERAINLSRHPLWPILRPVLYRMFHYSQAVALADRIQPLSGWNAMEHVSALLSLDVTVRGIDNIPAPGSPASGCILAPNHPTGIADGIAIFDALKQRRPDMAIFANRDALRASPRLRDLIIPVEWRAGEKSHAKSRDTLESTARAFAEKKAVVLFPSGRIAYWTEGKLTERPWQPSVVALARRYGFPVIPVSISARNSGLFYLLSKYSTELRDMTVFHELLNKKGRAFSITIGRPIPPERLDADSSVAAARLQHHAIDVLPVDPDAEFPPSAGCTAMQIDAMK